MSIYFILIAVVLLLPFVFVGIKDDDKRKNLVLFFSMIAVFLVLALKAPSVGRDIDGYQKIYEYMKNCSWSNFNVSWMEEGYELLMMIFNNVLHVPFQLFVALIYGFTCFSYFMFIKRYSYDCTVSVIIYICFTFFTFDMSAIRTMFGVAICLFTVPLAEKKGIKNIFLFVFIIFLAAQIHKSAYIFLFVYFIIKIPFSILSSIIYVGVPLALIVLRSSFFSFVNRYFKTVSENGSGLGGNLLIYIAVLFVTAFIWYNYDRDGLPNRLGDKVGNIIACETGNDSEIAEYENNENTLCSINVAMRIVYAGIVVQLIAANSALTRMAHYMQIFILIVIPYIISRFNFKSRVIIKIILYTLAIVYFWWFSLVNDPLDIVPYKFFWSVS